MRDAAARTLFVTILLGLSAPTWAATAQALKAGQPISQLPEELKGIGISDKKLGTPVAIQSLWFRDEKGARVTLADYFHSSKPVVLALAYYECPNLCTLVINGLTDAIKENPWVPGKDYEVITVSIDPKEDSALATEKKAAHMEALGRPEVAAGWHFLTGEESQIRALADQVGFGYRWVEAEKQYAHGAGVFLLTDKGVLSRVLYGIQYRAQDFKLGLLEASSGKVGGVVDRLMLFCFHYDPTLRKYSVAVTQIMKLGCVLTVVALGFLMGPFWWRQRRTARA